MGRSRGWYRKVRGMDTERYGGFRDIFVLTLFVICSHECWFGMCWLCLCLFKLGVWLCCIFCVVGHQNEAKKPSQCYSHVRLTTANSAKHQQRNFPFITEYLTEQAELSVMFYVTENLTPSQVRWYFSWFFSVAPYECGESNPNRQQPFQILTFSLL